MMPIHEEWIAENIILTTWQAPLDKVDIDACFKQIAFWIEDSKQETHVLIDLRESGIVPNIAPLSALRSKFLTNPHTGRVAVIGMERGPQILAQVAVNVSKKPIKFFPTRDEALDYLNNS